MTSAGGEKRQPLDTVVLKYLQKRGVKNAERALVVDAKLSKDATGSMSLVALGADAALSDLLVLHSLEDVEDDGKFDADSVLDGYARIREWIFGALDLYKS